MLFFHTTDGQAFYKVALEEWIKNGDWHCCHNHHGHTSCFPWDGLYSSCQLAGYPDVFSDVIHIVLDLHQEVLQWVKVVTLNIEEGVEPVVPEP